ncbi:YphA family membrane protein [Pontibacillus salipaludis]|uniref:YphA family membrane protein n=1 Tax=Pontibacillus salipaludis TaxID=1697394 RepID=UPI003CD052CA
MDQGLFFFFFCWGLWVVVTFLMSKTRMRLVTGMYLLILLISSGFSWEFLRHSGSYAVVVILVFSMLHILYYQKVIYPTLVALFVSIGYTGMLFFEKVVPVWVMMPRIVIVGVLSFVVVSILIESTFLRIAVWGFASVVGEWVYAIILSGYGYAEDVGDWAYLDVYSLVCSLVILNGGLVKVSEIFEQTVTNRIKRKVGFRS